MLNVVRRHGSPRVRAASSALYRASMTGLVRWLPGPRVLINSIPRAGTHLTVETVRRLPSMVYSGVHVQPETFGLSSGAAGGTDSASIAAGVPRTLSTVRNGQYATSHLPHSPALERAVGALGFRVLLVVRDPRDVAVSYALYVTAQRSHHLHRRFLELGSDDDRLMASIDGLPPSADDPGLAPIGRRIAGFIDWNGLPFVRDMPVRGPDRIGGWRHHRGAET